MTISVNKKNILIIDYNNVYEILSGESLITFLENIDLEKFNVKIVFNRTSKIEEILRNKNFNTEIIPFGVGGSIKSKIIQHTLLLMRLFSMVKKNRINLIHANNIMAGRPAIILKLIFRIPILIHIRNVGLIKQLKKYILKADHFAVVSFATMVHTFEKKYHKKCTVVYDGIDLNHYSKENSKSPTLCRSILGIPQNKIVIGMAGRISEQKGQKFFIDVAKNLSRNNSGVLFTHAGKIPGVNSNDIYETDLFNETFSLCNEGKFIWLDYINPIIDYWACVDIVVVPSCGLEAFGRVIIEAMSLQKPVIVTNSGGPEEIVVNGVNGFIVNMGDTVKLAEIIQILIADVKKREIIGLAARKTVLDLFNPIIYSNKVMGIYDYLLQKA